ncbi:hypothetical protein K490DRAFT_64836 [Saccharata proteae CBS 121410]|uniref:Metallo-beta-lactamase domain-containing protein n=1 Tax=Saccharata proteae CBS 121410 TaxID=1314787 RepID=A0A9P4HU99_9PEZI|nr:hypothetical protein K490DRAFT_64836 [Saccharata proteae CBS 121410]
MDGEELLVCKTCGTQFDCPATSPLPGCNICDDPRQFVPPTGQVWTSLGEMRGKYENKWQQDPEEPGMWSIWTEPKFGIGQRAILIETPHGNVLWDLITYLDQPTIDFINSRGPLHAIVISHPHYYTTHLTWSHAFSSPVYISAADTVWLNRAPSALHPASKFLITPTTDILPGITAIQAGGHFPGSLVLHWAPEARPEINGGQRRKPRLFIADTIVTVPSGMYHKDRPPGTTSFTFMWSIPNMLPLPPSEVFGIWKAIRDFEFEATHGAFVGMDVRRGDVKKAILESMKIQVRYEGHERAAIFDEM